MRKQRRTSAWQFEKEVREYLRDWRERPLASITRDDAMTAHDRITDENGGTTANRVLRQFRSLWNTASRRLSGTLPANPVSVTEDFFNPDGPPPPPLSWDELADWSRK